MEYTWDFEKKQSYQGNPFKNEMIALEKRLRRLDNEIKSSRINDYSYYINKNMFNFYEKELGKIYMLIKNFNENDCLDI